MSDDLKVVDRTNHTAFVDEDGKTIGVAQLDGQTGKYCVFHNGKIIDLEDCWTVEDARRLVRRAHRAAQRAKTDASAAAERPLVRSEQRNPKYTRLVGGNK